MDTLSSIKTFRQVVESGSFAAAAERLDISTGMVSKRVMHCEQRLGVRLLNRNSRKLSLTDPGRLYFERCKAILEDLQAAELELGSLGRAPRGTLRITLPSFTASGQMPRLLAEYGHRYPEVLIDASFEDRLADLVEEGYDIALRAATMAESLPLGLIARQVGRTAFHLAASREYLERRGVPRSPADLSNHDLITVGDPVSFRPPPAPPRIAQRYRSTGAAANAIAGGVGIGPIPEVMFEDPLFRDVLVPILPGYPLPAATLYLLYSRYKFVPLKIRTFVDFILESLSTPEEGPIVHSPGDHPQRARLARGRPSMSGPAPLAAGTYASSSRANHLSNRMINAA